jgi:flagellar biosynthesis/type III secretory pathway chaperone
MIDFDSLAADLDGHQTVCRQVLDLVEQEHRALRSGESQPVAALARAKIDLLPRLDGFLIRLRSHRMNWQGSCPTVRAHRPEVAAKMRQVQDVIMRILLLERENEQSWARRGLAPQREVSPETSPRPHFVADLYRRQGSGGAAR